MTDPLRHQLSTLSREQLIVVIEYLAARLQEHEGQQQESGRLSFLARIAELP